MKKITLKKIILRNFKGVSFFELTPDPNLTTIYGANRAGKSTLGTAPIWSKFGKDLQDRADFRIQTFDKDNNLLPDLEHSVEEIYDIDGEEISLVRYYVPTWTEKDGQKIVTGHTTEYKWCDVPLKRAKDFNEKITATFGTEETFKVLTNPLFFNEKLKMEDRRRIFSDIVGVVSDREIANTQARFIELMEKLTNKSLFEYRTQIKAQISKLRDRMELIPNLIIENKRNMPQEPDYDALNAEMTGTQAQVKEIESSLLDQSNALKLLVQERETYYRQLGRINDNLQTIEANAQEESFAAVKLHNEKILEVKSGISELSSGIRASLVEIARNHKAITEYKERQTSLRFQFQESVASVLIFDADQFKCPTCNTPFDADKAEEKKSALLGNFNQNKSKRQAEINAEGVALSKKIQALAEENTKSQAAIDEAQKKLDDLNSKLPVLESMTVQSKSLDGILGKNEDYKQLKNEKDKLLAIPPKEATPDNNIEIEVRKSELQKRISEIQAQLDIKNQVDRITKRNDELTAEQKQLAQQLTVLKRETDTMDAFEDTKIKWVEDRINKLFKTVKIKMFERQMNGEMKDVCDTLINGVPFPAANSAGRIRAGIEIINVLHQHYGLILPIIIDNAEGITEELPETEAQMITMYAKPGFNNLTVIS